MSYADLKSKRWIEDLTITLTDERPNVKLKLVINADTRKEYTIKKSKEKTIRWHGGSKDKILCQKVEEIKIVLGEVHRDLLSEDKHILSINVPLNDSFEITHKDTVHKVTVWLKLARGSLQDEIKEIRGLTDEQNVVLDKMGKICGFFDGLESVGGILGEMPYVGGISKALLSIYRLFKEQEKCRDTARDLVDDIEDILNYGSDRLSESLATNKRTRRAFQSIVEVIEAALKLIVDESKGMLKGILDAFSKSYKSKMDELREKLRKAKVHLNDSINFGMWTKIDNADLKSSLQFIPSAYYCPGNGCLENTRVDLLDHVDSWVRNTEKKEKVLWVKGHAGSGKSALMNSVMERLEDAGIPFTCFMCNEERSDALRVLPTIAYDLTRHYENYRGRISVLLEEHASRSIFTGDIKNQIKLLFGESPSYEVISPKGENRPLFHVILVDALDECQNSDRRNDIAKHLRHLANAIHWIKVIIASRPDSGIAKTLGNAYQDSVDLIDINDVKWATDADICLFIEDESKKLDLNLESSLVNRLREKASGFFLWCTTVFLFIKESMDDKMRTLETILGLRTPVRGDDPLAPLYVLYQHVLDTAVKQEKDRNLMNLILSIIYLASSRQPLSAIAVSDILFPDAKTDEETNENRQWVGRIVAQLGAILYVEEKTHVIRTCHPTIFDYTAAKLNQGFPKLTGDTYKTLREPFSVRLEEMHKRAFDGCLKIMDSGLHFNICGLEESFRLNKDVLGLSDLINEYMSEALRYSILFWFYHLEQSRSKTRKIRSRILTFLISPMAVYWVEALSLLNAVDRGVIMLQGCATVFTDQPGTEILDRARDWERFLLGFGDALNSTPHLYLSALPWLPRDSKLRKSINDSSSPEPFPFELPKIITNVAKVWNAERWSRHPGVPSRSVAYFPDGKLFAASCSDGMIFLWDARSMKRVGRPLVSEHYIRSISVSRDGQKLASAHDDGIVRLWSIHSDDPGPTLLKGHIGPVTSVTFSSTGKRLVSGSTEKTMIVWDVERGVSIMKKMLDSHTGPIISVIFSADDKRIFSGSEDGTVRTLDSTTGEKVGETLNAALINCVACSPNGKLIAFNDGNDVVLANAKTGAGAVNLTGHNQPIRSVCFSADSRYLASGSCDYLIRIWNVQTRLLVRTLRGHTGTVNSVCFSPDEWKILSGSSDGTVRVWDYEENLSQGQPSKGRTRKIHCVAYSCDGRRIASSSSDGRIYMWDSCTGVATRKPFPGHKTPITTMSFSEDNRWLVSGSSDKSQNLRVWDIISGTGKPLQGHTSSITSVAFSRDSRHIASGSNDKTVRLWDVATYSTIAVLNGHTSGVSYVAFSVGGRDIISVSCDGTVRMWDVRTHPAAREPLLLPVPSQNITSATVSPDGRWIAAASEDDAYIWNISSDVKLSSTISLFSRCLTFSPDSKYLIAASWSKESGNKTVLIWNVRTGKAAGSPLQVPIGFPLSLAYSPNGQEIVAGTTEGLILVWNTQSRTDQDDDEAGDYSDVGEEGRARLRICDGWLRNKGNLLLWVPLQYRQDIRDGARLVIGAPEIDTARPQIDYNSLLGYCRGGRSWKDIYNKVEEE